MRPASLVLVSTLALTAVAEDIPSAQTAPAKAGRATGKGEGGAARIPADLKVVNNIVFKRVGETKLELMPFLPLEKKFERSPLVVYIAAAAGAFEVIDVPSIEIIDGMPWR